MKEEDILCAKNIVEKLNLQNKENKSIDIFVRRISIDNLNKLCTLKKKKQSAFANNVIKLVVCSIVMSNLHCCYRTLKTRGTVEKNIYR